LATGVSSTLEPTSSVSADSQLVVTDQPTTNPASLNVGSSSAQNADSHGSAVSQFVQQLLATADHGGIGSQVSAFAQSNAGSGSGDPSGSSSSADSRGNGAATRNAIASRLVQSMASFGTGLSTGGVGPIASGALPDAAQNFLTTPMHH
jgi:hypothetical protein